MPRVYSAQMASQTMVSERARPRGRGISELANLLSSIASGPLRTCTFHLHDMLFVDVLGTGVIGTLP